MKVTFWQRSDVARRWVDLGSLTSGAAVKDNDNTIRRMGVNSLVDVGREVHGIPSRREAKLESLIRHQYKGIGPRSKMESAGFGTRTSKPDPPVSANVLKQQQRPAN